MRFLTKKYTKYLTLILYRAADVQKRETKLKEDERVSVIVQAPHDPQHVTQQEQPESPVALELFLRTNHPRGDDRHQHRGPLNRIKYVHRSVSSVKLSG